MARRGQCALHPLPGSRPRRHYTQRRSSLVIADIRAPEAGSNAVFEPGELGVRLGVVPPSLPLHTFPDPKPYTRAPFLPVSALDNITRLEFDFSGVSCFSRHLLVMTCLPLSIHTTHTTQSHPPPALRFVGWRRRLLLLIIIGPRSLIVLNSTPIKVCHTHTLTLTLTVHVRAIAYAWT